MNPSNGSQRRDDLALVRTELANERTLLAYGRTGLLFIGTGVSLIKILNLGERWVTGGYALCAVGGLIVLLGLIRFTRLHRRLRCGNQ